MNAANRQVTGSFQVTDAATGEVTDPFDVEFYNGNLLISDISGGGINGDGVDLIATDGTYLQRLVSSDGMDGIDFPQQLSAKFSDSNFWRYRLDLKKQASNVFGNQRLKEND